MLTLGLHTKMQNVLNTLAEKSNRDTETTHNVYLLFLRGLLQALASLPKSKKDKYEQSIQTINGNYIRLYIKRKPQWQKHPVVDPLGCRRCAPCQSLDAFLRDSDQTVKRSSHAKVIRDHLSDQIGKRICTTTDKKGSPHTLLVEKKESGTSFWPRLQAYETRKAKANQVMESLNLSTLSGLLGVPEKGLIDFDSLRNKDIIEGRARQPLSDVSRSATANVTRPILRCLPQPMLQLNRHCKSST